MVHAVTSGTPLQEILKDAPDTGYTGGAGLMPGSSRHGSSSGGRRRRVGGGGGGEGQQYPALVDRALATLMKVQYGRHGGI